MKINEKSRIITVPINIIATIVAVMILLRFSYVFYDFIQNPFHPPATLGEASVRHVMTALILLELLALTLRFLVQEVIDPNLIIITVLTALGRDLIVMNFNEVDYLKILAIGFVFGIALFGLYILEKRSN